MARLLVPDQPRALIIIPDAYELVTAQLIQEIGERIGTTTAAVVRWQMEHRPHAEQGYRACLGLMRLARQYGEERLEAACARAQSIRAPHYRSVKSILECGLDRQGSTTLGGTTASMPVQDNVRGPGYYSHH